MLFHSQPHSGLFIPHHVSVSPSSGLVRVHAGVSSAGQGPLAKGRRRDVALFSSPHPGAMSGRQLLYRENGLLGVSLRPGLHSSSVRAINQLFSVDIESKHYIYITLHYYICIFYLISVKKNVKYLELRCEVLTFSITCGARLMPGSDAVPVIFHTLRGDYGGQESSTDCIL